MQILEEKHRYYFHFQLYSTKENKILNTLSYSEVNHKYCNKIQHALNYVF